MGGFVAVLLTALSSVVIAYTAHLLGFTHFHLIGGIPLGAAGIGAGAAIGAAVAVRMFATYDTSSMRVIAQMGGLAAYAAAVGLGYLSAHPDGLRTPLFQQVVDGVRYLQLLVVQGGDAFVEQLPARLQLPVQIRFWIGAMRLIIEIIGAVVATGWMLSLMTDVPFCWKNRRFYELRSLTESANAQAVREWEMAMNQRRPVEARAILARVRAAKVRREDKRWVRIAVHQCTGCHASRVRIERRRRAPGFVRTEGSDEMTLDAARGAALLAT